MRSCLPLEGGIPVSFRLVFLCLCDSVGDQYTASVSSPDAQIKISPPLVCM